MIKKELRESILNKFSKKSEKIFASSIIDKINKIEYSSYITFTHFLDFNEKNIAVIILNKFNINYYIFSPLEDTSRFVIFFTSDRIDDINVVFDKYISCIKICAIKKCELTHKDCMGAIYSLGLKREQIGDIFLCNNICYLFTFKSNENYILNNLTSISKYQVNLERLSVINDDIKSIKINFKNYEVIVPSLRADVILSEVFNITREQSKKKISSGDLFINSKEMFYVSYIVKTGDIISLRKFGKLKIGNVLRNTKSGKIVIAIQKYS